MLFYVDRNHNLIICNYRHAFLDAVEEDDARHHVAFTSMERTLQRRQRLNTPANPTSLEEAEQKMRDLQLEDPESVYTKNLVDIVSSEEGGDLALIFVSPRVGEILDVGIRHVSSDATFSVVPVIFSQYFVVMMEYAGVKLPACHVLMSNKSQNLYLRVLSSLKSHYPAFNPLLSMSDYELAIMNSWSQSFDGIKIKGCRFHLAQSLLRKIGKLGLKNRYSHHKPFQSWVRLIMGLCLLPADRIVPTFDRLKAQRIQGLGPEEWKLKRQFLRYFQRTWLTRSSPEIISVFGMREKTNNAIEAFNRNVKARFRVPHPPLFPFIVALNRLISHVDDDIVRLQHGQQVRRKQPIGQKKKDERIRRYEGELTRGEIDEMDFLHKASYLYYVSLIILFFSGYL